MFEELSMKKAISDIAEVEDVLMVENIIPVER